MTLPVPLDLPNVWNFYSPNSSLLKKGGWGRLHGLLCTAFQKRNIPKCACLSLGRRQVSVPIVLSSGLVRTLLKFLFIQACAVSVVAYGNKWVFQLIDTSSQICEVLLFLYCKNLTIFPVEKSQSSEEVIAH